MSVSLQGGNRPPYVTFEERSIEDRAQSIAKGRRVDRAVDWAILRQSGSKDNVEVEASVWLAGLDKDPNMVPLWADKFKADYERWKKGQEATPDGTHVSQWPAISKAEATTLIACNVRTVEDLASANEPTLVRIGIGARNLQNKAKEWLKVADGTGRAAEELAALRARVMAQDDQLESMRK